MLTKNRKLRALREEIRRTHSLLFHRDPSSLKLGSEFYGLLLREFSMTAPCLESQIRHTAYRTPLDRLFKPTLLSATCGSTPDDALLLVTTTGATDTDV